MNGFVALFLNVLLEGVCRMCAYFKSFLSLVGIFFVSHLVLAQPIAEWDFQNHPGSSTPLAGDAVGQGVGRINTGNLELVGVQSHGIAGDGDFFGINWPTGDVNLERYYQFSVQAESGFEFTLSAVQYTLAVEFRSNAIGPQDFQLRASRTNFQSDNGVILANHDVSCIFSTNRVIPITVTDFTPLGIEPFTELTFRLYGFGSGGFRHGGLHNHPDFMLMSEAEATPCAREFGVPATNLIVSGEVLGIPPVLDFQGPAHLSGPPDSEQTTDIVCVMSHVSGPFSVNAWSFGIEVSAPTATPLISNLSLSGTDVEALLNGEDPFLEIIEILPSGNQAVVSVILPIDATGAEAIPVDQSGSSIARFSLSAQTPNPPTTAEVAELFVEYVSGLQGVGEPIPIEVSQGVQKFIPETNSLTIFLQAPVFKRGDVNDDDQVATITDITASLFYIFFGSQIPCEDAADFNADDNIDIADPISMIDYSFRGMFVPSFIIGECTFDGSEDGIGCEEYASCD